MRGKVYIQIHTKVYVQILGHPDGIVAHCSSAGAHGLRRGSCTFCSCVRKEPLRCPFQYPCKAHCKHNSRTPFPPSVPHTSPSPSQTTLAACHNRDDENVGRVSFCCPSPHARLPCCLVLVLVSTQHTATLCSLLHVTETYQL